MGLGFFPHAPPFRLESSRGNRRGKPRLLSGFSARVPEAGYGGGAFAGPGTEWERSPILDYGGTLILSRMDRAEQSLPRFVRGRVSLLPRVRPSHRRLPEGALAAACPVGGVLPGRIGC